MNKNILIIGASGFVGRALIRRLLPKDNNLFLISRDKKFKIAYIKESLQFKGLSEDIKLATELKIDFFQKNS